MSASAPRVDRECVEGYVYCHDPLRLLILRRPPSRGRVWSFVSGKVEPEDRDFEAAMRRELAEETGVTDPRSVRALDWHVTFPSPEGGETWRLHGFAVELDGPVVPTLSAEHEEFAWVDPETAILRLHFPDNREVVRVLLRALGASSA